MNFSGRVIGGQATVRGSDTKPPTSRKIGETLRQAQGRQWCTRLRAVYRYRLAEETPMRMLLNWVLSAVAVWIVAQLGIGISVRGAVSALIAALVIGFINATIGAVLKVITFPLTLVTLGLFWFVINALMLELASALLAPGFQVRTFTAAFLGAIVLSLVNMVLKWLISPSRDR